MYRDQLYCVLSPPADYDVAQLDGVVMHSRAALEAVLVEVGEVHYASLFVLPPRPSDAGPTRCVRLGLELTTDEGAAIDDVLTRLVAGGLDALWPLYAVHSDLPDETAPAERKRWLAAFLVRWVRCADGGFVGARDTTVRQVREEAGLYAEMRREGDVLAPLRLDRDELGSLLSCATHEAPALAARVPGSHQAVTRQRGMAAEREAAFPWADRPAPTSAWCAETLGTGRRLARIAAFSLRGVWLLVLLVVGATAFAALGAIVAAAGWIVPSVVSLCPRAAAWVVPPAGAVWDVLAVGTASRGRVPLALPILWSGTALAGGLVFWLRQKGAETGLVVAIAISALLLFVAITVLVGLQLAVSASTDGPLYTGWLAPLQDVAPVAKELARWGAGWLLATGALGAALLITLLVAIAFAPPDRGTGALAVTALLVVLVVGALAHVALYAAVFPDLPGLGARVAEVVRVDAVYVTSLLIVGAAAVTLRVAAKLFARLAMPVARRRMAARLAVPVPRAHQVHESIVRCEADLVNRCNHMISLTELRPPVALRRATTWLVLRAVGRLADTWWYRGELGNASGIHFAHWYLVDEGRRLLFLSNYDGDFSGYLDEFIRGSAEGTNLIWRGSRLLPRRAAAPHHPAVRHPRAFPTVTGFVLRGCAHEQWFKAYVRDSMLPHLFRFAAYDRSLQNILAARRVRNAACGKRHPVKDDALLRALER